MAGLVHFGVLALKNLVSKTQKAALRGLFCLAHKDHLPTGNPVGWMYPNFQATKMQINSSTEKPIRKASARAMLLVLALPSLPSFNMKKSAAARLARMAKNASATKYVISGIIG